MSGFSLNLVLQQNRVSIGWHMTKLQIKSDRITSFGGIYLVNRLLDQFSLGKVINDTLDLCSTAHDGYQWDEIVKSLFDIYHTRSLMRTLCSCYLWLCARTSIPLSCTKSERSSATSNPNIGWRNSSVASSLFLPNGWGQQGSMCSDYLLTDHTTD